MPKEGLYYDTSNRPFAKTGDISFFGDSQTAKAKEYLAAEQDVRRLRAELVATYGEEINDLLDDYNEALGNLEEFIYETTSSKAS